MIHEELSKRKLHGCQTYDCIGAGQRVAGMFPAEEKQENMEEIFHKMFLLHEMLWYLTEACSITVDEKKKEMIKIMMDEIDLIRELEVKVFLKRNLDELKQKVDRYLKDVSKEVMERFPIARKKEKQMDYMGKNLKGKDLSGMDFSMSFLIAANLCNTNLTGTNFLGADMRDTNISGADLRESVFLTQMQVNGAKGDEKTLLPRWIKRPSTW
ncbi:oxetanocin A resistance protein [Lachnospiraceae bacterium KM106-2]|nr:oxetanocin A resistance protein [Lachnospiraceae bacterium KM106-2]